MLKMISTALVCMMLQMPALATPEESQWYKPPSYIRTHDNHPNFYFLLGDWESRDPAVMFKESWNTTVQGDLCGFRSFQDDNLGVYEVFAFEPSMHGAMPRMRRMSSQLADLSKERLTGNWSTPQNHRGEITFRSDDAEHLLISYKYDSPDQNTLNLQIQTTSKGGTTSKKFVLKRSAPKKIDPKS